ncbi:MAG: hypothetical protein ABJA32_10015 [Ginsengibacter sp.]|jgi:hypothetical protein
METIFLQTNNAEEVKLVQSFLLQNKIKGRVLSESEKEDIVLGRLMEETDYNDLIDKDSFVSKLRS